MSRLRSVPVIRLATSAPTPNAVQHAPSSGARACRSLAT